MNLLSRPTRLYLASIALAATGVFAIGADAAPAAGEPMPMVHGHAGGMVGGMGHRMDSPMLEGMLPRMLDRVNATSEQRAQIKQIVDQSAGDLRAQRDTGRALHEQAMALFSQPTVDANAVEALRLKQMAVHDAASKRMTLAMLEISRVLTPEQRKQMAERMAQRHDMMQRHQRERQGMDAPKS